MNTNDAGSRLGSDLSDELGPLVVGGLTFEPLRLPVPPIPVPQIARGLPKEVHVFSREMVLAAVAAECEACREVVEECIRTQAHIASNAREALSEASARIYKRLRA